MNFFNFSLISRIKQPSPGLNQSIPDGGLRHGAAFPKDISYQMKQIPSLRTWIPLLPWIATVIPWIASARASDTDFETGMSIFFIDSKAAPIKNGHGLKAGEELKIDGIQAARSIGNREIISFVCKAQTRIETISALEGVMGMPVENVKLDDNEQIDGVSVSKSGKMVALAIKNGTTTTIMRIVVISPERKTVCSYNVKPGNVQKGWCAEIGAISDCGKYVMAQLAAPDGTYVGYRWFVVRLADFKPVEAGLDQLLEAWSGQEKPEAPKPSPAACPSVSSSRNTGF